MLNWAEIVKKVCVWIYRSFENIGLLNHPIPSTRALSKYIYPNFATIVDKITKILKYKNKVNFKRENFPSDIPNLNFEGPF